MEGATSFRLLRGLCHNICAAGSSTYYDYSDEEVFYEGSPSAGDLAINVALGATLIWLPLTAASIGRFAFVKYRVTDKRVSVTTKAPWQGVKQKLVEEERMLQNHFLFVHSLSFRKSTSYMI